MTNEFSPQQLKHLEDLRTALNKRDLAISKRQKIEGEIDELNDQIKALLELK